MPGVVISNIYISDMILYLNITMRPFASISLAHGLDLLIPLEIVSCGNPRDSTISEVLEPFGKIRNSKIFEIFSIGGETKYLGDFYSHDSS